MPTEDHKVCSKCGEQKPLDCFYKQRQCKLGVTPDCKECRSASARAARAANPEKYRERDRLRYAGEAERRIAQARAYYAANREAQKKKRREHFKANRETYRAYMAKRKARERNVPHEPYTRREIYDRDGGVCQMCGVVLPYEPGGFDLDHIVPIFLGGPDTPANLQLACQPCNRGKGIKLEGQIHFGC